MAYVLIIFGSKPSQQGFGSFNIVNFLIYHDTCLIDMRDFVKQTKTIFHFYFFSHIVHLCIIDHRSRRDAYENVCDLCTTIQT